MTNSQYISYKQAKEDFKEISSDIAKTVKWMSKTAKKIKKFNERDIFEEHDTVFKQIKELSDRVNKINATLAESIHRASEGLEDITRLYKMIIILIDKIKNLEENKADKINALQEAFGSLLASGECPPFYANSLSNAVRVRKLVN